MMHLSREEAERIQRDTGRVIVSMKLVSMHIQEGSRPRWALTVIVAGSIVFIPGLKSGSEDVQKYPYMICI